MVAPGCTKRVPLLDSTRAAAILRRVDLPEPLRPIRQTRSAGDTDNSTPASSGVPPKVSLMSLSWMSGGAMVLTLLLRGYVRALALNATDGLIERRQEGRAVARRERACPAGVLAGLAQIGHQIAYRQGHSDRFLRKWFAVRRDHLGTQLDAAA